MSEDENLREAVDQRYEEFDTAWQTESDEKIMEALVNLETALRNKIGTGPVALKAQTLDAGLVFHPSKDVVLAALGVIESK